MVRLPAVYLVGGVKVGGEEDGVVVDHEQGEG